MNVKIDPKLIEDSAKITMGIKYLQNRMMYVVNRHVDRNSDYKTIVEKHSDELATIKDALTEFLTQQRDMEAMIKEAEKEVGRVEKELEDILADNNIKIDDEQNVNNQA